MALSTTQSIWRSGGGDNTRTAYCGTGLMVAEFYIDPTDMGYIGYTDTSVVDPNGLLSAADADAGKQVFTWATATVPGVSLGVAMSTTQMVTLTGGATTGDAATGGSITGQILYYVTDPLIGQQNV